MESGRAGDGDGSAPAVAGRSGVAPGELEVPGKVWWAAQMGATSSRSRKAGKKTCSRSAAFSPVARVGALARSGACPCDCGSEVRSARAHATRLAHPRPWFQGAWQSSRKRAPLPAPLHATAASASPPPRSAAGTRGPRQKPRQVCSSGTSRGLSGTFLPGCPTLDGRRRA
eukprot:944177-Prymnesium_polylepis.1